MNPFRDKEPDVSFSEVLSIHAIRIHDRGMTLDDLFAGRNVVSTPEVAEYLGITEAEAREWGAENDVDRAGFNFAWSEQDVEDLAAEFDEDDFDDEDEDEEALAENPLDDIDDEDEDEDQDEDDFDDEADELDDDD